MKCAKFKFNVAACVVALMLAIALVGGVSASSVGDTVKDVCSRCHSNRRICLNVGVKTNVAWVSTVGKMVDKGAQLSPDSIDEVAGYLSGLAPGTGSVCQ
ncbi:MAG: hypothetical protein JEY79_12875 [Pseudodesulfovibrio sp.]|nr:hypothetical protein [Pseudodesulfovibrio sp.]